MSEKKIGVFDSGIGGMTVLAELLHAFPNESFVYLGDTARLPYGSKSPQTIRKYSEQNIDYLIGHDVKAVVIACNSASAQFREKEWKGIPVYNVIEPGAETALALSESKRIGVLGTRATINSKAYTKEILKLNPHATVYDIACPLFVPLAEEGWDNDPVTNLIVYRYVSQLLPMNIDTLILGCTHYPLLKNSIARATGQSIVLVDSGHAITQWLRKDFQEGRLQPASEKNKTQDSRTIEILTTDFSEQFLDLAQKILAPEKASTFTVVNL